MQIQPYLFFEGRAEEAIEFYKKTLGAKVEMIMRFSEAPDQSMISPGSGNKVMHAAIHIGETTVLASDGRNTGKPEFQGFSLTIYAKDEAEADRLFAMLGEGGQVRMPMDKTFFAKRFGMVADKFGVGWMIIVPAQ
ncbi:MAG: VOC family protein [Pseudolabrys sp.]